MNALEQARTALANAEGLLIACGAGMSVASGIADYRSEEGLWRAWPPAEKAGLTVSQLVTPGWLETSPTLAWGFYGTRLAQLRHARPHRGHEALVRLSGQIPTACLTSNVDGLLQKAGLAPVHELHGRLERLQCSLPCGRHTWDAPNVEVDATLHASRPLPRCPHCGALARPNLLMFDDYSYIGDASEAQAGQVHQWFQRVRGRKLVVLEVGAGTAVQTLRWQTEQYQAYGATLIRVNLHEAFGPAGVIALEGAAEEVLVQLAGG